MKKYMAMMVMLLAACGQNDSNTNKVEDINAEPVVAEAEQSDALVKLDINSNHHDVNAKVGQEVELTLDANATTGYKWSFVTYVNQEDVVEELEEKYIPDEADGKVGVGGKAVYRIKLLKAGEIYVTANYVRGEDSKNDESKEDEYSVKVIIE